MRSLLTGLVFCALALAYDSHEAVPSAPPGRFAIRGHVVDAVTKAPLPGVRVNAVSDLDAAGASSGFTQTDAHGAYVFASRPAGPIAIEAFVSGYDPVLEKLTLANDVTRDFALTVFVRHN